LSSSSSTSPPSKKSDNNCNISLLIKMEAFMNYYYLPLLCSKLLF
jgi:hypothetical protein